MRGAVTLSCLISPVYADNLLQVYHQALLNDPVYAQAESTWHSEQMNLPIARAGYLTQFSVTGYGNRNYREFQPVVDNFNNNGYTWQYGYTLSLSQPIFNLVAWNAIKQASATVKAATATYLAAEQSLIQRTATAYFNVLQAYDRLRYTVANKKAVYQQLVTSEQKFNVGLIAVTDVYDARSQYDQVVAEEIAAQNNLNIQLENLRAITGKHYKYMYGLGKQLPLLKPQPANINRWVSVANQQNYQIKAQRYTVQASMDTIKQTAAGGYPTVSVDGGFTEAHVAENNVSLLSAGRHTTDETAHLGLSLTYKPIQGGLVIASTKQARFNYVTASGLLEQTYRSVVNQTRSSYLSVVAGISQVKADAQRIVSAKNALAATKAGFSVGTRTMVDVLNDLTTLYQAQQQYADDQYAYLNHLIALKQAAGTLSFKDLKQINAWLSKNLRLHKYNKPVKPLRPVKGYHHTDRLVKKPSSGSVLSSKSKKYPMVKSDLHHQKISKKIAVVKTKKPKISEGISQARLQLPRPVGTTHTG